ncbi:Domain of unknown function DUF1767 domain-containing protein [Strongyloides ratti]|uniref:RecQ-mediated genome instability protein 1 n=1 Tax=Strongyloides ratti TaxID=34506 RepID=A0A090LEI3_STRRB|nr:Domain of unknown function DUF1767 domain-containing protein [Strongyloides ratti]CEF65930.1 Domain of unknown function DUF1767 domain-containing protein [Strongyloides ratti]
MDLGLLSDSLILFFSKLHISLNKSWLKDTITYLNSQITDIKSDQYKNFVFYQLIHSNLSDSINIKQNYFWNEDKKFHHEKINLFVQVKCIYDISRSVYEQYLEMSVRNCVSIGNFELESSSADKNSSNNGTKYLSKGMLMLKMTDGKNDFTAIESEYIPFLSEYFRPGIKIYIFGECKIANGIIHLTRNNCQIIGGESSSDFSQNTLDMVLFRLLPKNNISDKEKKQARKFCIDKMKEIDSILCDGQNNSLEDFSNNLPKELDERNENLNKENKNTKLLKTEVLSKCSPRNDLAECDILPSKKKISVSNTTISISNNTNHTIKRTLSSNISNSPTKCIKKEIVDLTVSEIFDYFFKLHIFLSNKWISNIIQEVNNKYSDQNQRIKYIYDIFLQTNIDECLIAPSPEFRKGNQTIETSLLMEIESIHLAKRHIMGEKIFYTLSDGNKGFNAIIKQPFNSNICNQGHLIPGIKFVIRGQLKIKIFFCRISKKR